MTRRFSVVPTYEVGRPTTESGIGIGRATEAEREIYVLEERVRELELRLRERVESESVLELELRAMRRELEVKHSYIATLETAQGGLHMQLRDAAENQARLANELATADFRATELGALVAALQNRKSARAAAVVARALRLPGRALRRARTALRSLVRK